MPKVYQPVVIEKAETLIEVLIESEFFSDYEIESYDFARNYLCDKLTDKFLLGELDESDGESLFSEDEFSVFLREIIAGSILNELKMKGLVESYEDDNTEEMFFLTEMGKNHLKKNEEGV